VRGLSQLGLEHLHDALDIAEYVVVPDPDDAIAEPVEVSIPFAVSVAIRVLSAIHFNDKPPLAACEIGVIRADRILADEFETGELSVAEVTPEQCLSARVPAPQRSRPLGRRWVRSAHRTQRPYP
jgi:hypothetical protein